MALPPFLYTKQILIDDAGWGDLILGVVIGALKLPERKYMERRIPVFAFQSPDFADKKYLDEAVKIAEEIVEVMKPDTVTYFKVCSGYVLSGIRTYLRTRGFHVEKTAIIGELQDRVEKAFVDWCVEVGIPRDSLEGESKRRFYTILRWVAEKIEVRESLVKTGWKSWRERWRREANRIHLQAIAESRKKYYT